MHRGLWGVALVLLSSVTANAGFELRGVYIGGKAPWIKVSARRDPEVYDTSEGKLNFGIGIRGRCPEKHSLKNASVTLAGTSKDIFVNTNNRSIGAGHGQEWVNVPVSVPYVPPRLAGGDTPEKACNRELARRVKSGKRRAALLRDGFMIMGMGAYDGHLSVGCRNNKKIGYSPDSILYASDKYDVVIDCLPTGYQPQRIPTPPPARNKPAIESVQISMSPLSEEANCPVNLTFKGRVTASPESSYGVLKTKYRFRGNDGFATDEYPLSLERGKSVSVVWRRFIEAPRRDAGDSLAGTSGPSKIPVYEGWMKLEVRSPDGPDRESQAVHFRVDCNENPKRGKLKN